MVINEYMPWPSNSCGTTSEYVELLNFGPLAVNIGCYILTNGKYSVTIPANTILQPGQYYLIAGQATLPLGCGNSDSLVHANLNWSTCGCTNTTIPTTGDGFMTDGGGANVNMVLMKPDLTVVDAVTRDLPVDSVTAITTASTGSCTGKTFDLDTVSATYETLGMSTGKANAFARKLDGDCDWVKQTQLSANATNNTPTSTSEVTYELNIVNSMDCSGAKGSIEIYVKFTRDYAEIFPMTYTLIFDSNNNNQFDSGDSYTVGTDNTPPDIVISNLPQGRYSITLASTLGCYLKTFTFSILPCQGVLPVHLVYFKSAQQKAESQTFEWKLADVEYLATATLERSKDGKNWAAERVIYGDASSGSKVYSQAVPYETPYFYYRLRLTGKNGKVTYSPVLNVNRQRIQAPTMWPNPAKDFVNVEMTAQTQGTASYTLTNINGLVVKQGINSLAEGVNVMQVPVQNLQPGIYQLTVASKTKGTEPISFRFVKQ
ncbi:MAG: type sorting protein [Flaviaesturariibacter sp.]|nr:type sorting protein [Flaviaesturariibacter sp.]